MCASFRRLIIECLKNIPCGFGALKQTNKIPMVIVTPINNKNATIAIVMFGIDQRKRFLKNAKG